MKLVITMSRRFGTGASIIASELSERLGVPVYDKAYIEEKINDHEYESEAEAIRKLAEKPCIILGRCASDILKDRMNVLNIFVQTKKTASCVSCKKIIWITTVPERKWKRLTKKEPPTIMNIPERPGAMSMTII